MARAFRRAGLGLALPALVGTSTLLHWLAGRRIAGLWIMPDEAIYADRAIGFWRDGHLTVLRGQGAGYSVLYPIVAGIPWAVGDISRGYSSLKLLQALVMSLTAAVVVTYGRRLMPTGYAVLAALLTVASPLLLYSGFVMTEVLYYPVAALALLAIARAVATAAMRDQILALTFVTAALLTRTQAVVLVAVFAAAILLDAVLGGGRSRLRRFWPVWCLIALVALAVGARPGLLGAYAGTFRGNYPVAASAKFVYYHLAYAIVEVAVAPVVALALLLWEATRGRERDPGARALVAVTTSSVLLVTMQVGLFAARYAPHLLGRDLAALPPVLFLVFALWLARGAPRTPVVTSVVVVGVLAILVAAPWDDLVSDVAIPDTMGIALIHRSYNHLGPGNAVAIGAAIMLVLLRFLPRRLMTLVAVLVLGVLVASSAFASRLVAGRVTADQQTLVGSPRDWIDRSAAGPVAYVFDGAETANTVWLQRFWNRRVTHVVSVLPADVPGPLVQTRLRIGADGRLPVRERYAVANDRITLAGTPIAHQARGPDSFGLTLWRLDEPARIVSIANSIKPNGDILTSAWVEAFACAGGQLQVTLLPKSTDRVVLELDGKPMVTANLAGHDYWNGTVNVPRGPRSGPCIFTIEGGLLLGSTRLVFVPS